MTEYKKYVIEHVLSCFRDMGATPDQLHHEERLLANDDKYLYEWACTTGFYEIQLTEIYRY